MNRMLDRHYHRIMMSDTPRDQQQFIKDNLICVDITNAARWFIEESEQECWDYDKDFPCVVPPWPLAWFEYTNHRFVEKCSGVETLAGIRAIGLRSIIISDIPKEQRKNVLHSDFVRMLMEKIAIEKGWGTIQSRMPTETYIEGLKIRAELIENEIIKDRVPRWICIFSYVMEAMKRKPINLGVEGWYLDESGRPMGTIRYSLMAGHPWVMNSKNQERLKQEFQTIIAPFFFALSLLHCKNVYVEDAPPTKTRARKARKQKNRGNVTYKVMIVDPLRKQVRKDCGGNNRTSIKQALHIVRGHFKDYRDGPGLFGKYRDVYWWDMHARGDAEYGEIKKDYEVKRRKRSHAGI